MQNNDYDISMALQAIEDELQRSMLRNLERHIKEVDEGGIEFTMWQAEQLKALETYKANNLEKFVWHFDVIDAEIERKLMDAFKRGGFEQEKKIIQAIKKGWKNPSTRANTANVETSANFFTVNETKLNELIRATRDDIHDANYAMLRQAEDQYRQAIFNAQVYYNTGAGSLMSAVKMATIDYIRRGIQSVEYSNGRRVNAQSYAEMALRTANKRAYLYGEAQKRDEWDVHTVIVTRRGVACPRCQQYTGRVFMDDVFGSWRPTGIQKYPLISTAMAGGLYHPNCKDTHTTYFEGLDEDLVKPMTEEEREKASRVYELQQEQRYNERNIRKYKRLSELSVDDSTKDYYNIRVSTWQERQSKLIAENAGTLRRNYNRERVFGMAELDKLRASAF